MMQSGVVKELVILRVVALGSDVSIPRRRPSILSSILMALSRGADQSIRVNFVGEVGVMLLMSIS